jgi:predicted GIY-YIG superfamily endonuclease
MWYVYALQSVNADFVYVGRTYDVDKRVREHNEGLNQSTKHYAPFILGTYVAVTTEEKAMKLEKYFKTGSGKAIRKKRFL